MPAQLDYAGQLAPILTGLADRKGGCFIYDEHGGRLDLSAWQVEVTAWVRDADLRRVPALLELGVEAVWLKVLAPHAAAHSLS